MSGGDGVGFSIDPTTVREWKRYPEYTDSGVDWIGEVPAGWETSSIKRHFSVQLGKMLQNQPNGPGDTLRPYLRAANISWGKVLIDDLKEMWFSESEKAQYRIEKGDLLVSEGGDVGRAALWNDELDECYIQNAINRVRSRNGALSSHLYYWTYFLKHVGYIDTLCNKATIAHYTAEKVMNTVYLCPPLPEQHAIAAFLDRETARIDALIAKKRRFIELLEEKRQALITQAVTKGLDPDVEMKDSGVEWLGEVPAGWLVTTLRRICRVQQGLQIPQAERYYDPGLGRLEYITVKSIHTEDAKDIKEYIQNPPERVVCHPEDILFARTGATGEVITGYCGAFHNNFFKVVYDKRSACKDFLVYYLQNDLIKQHFCLMAGTTTIPDLNHNEFLDSPAVLPPLLEQMEIVNYINSAMDMLAQQKESASQSVALLDEYRTALITAAVTGKIDVRGEVPANP
jgi:type I restriction enzyme S subunit